jgi:hypothetical protein
MIYELLDPKEWLLEVTPTMKSQLWEQSQLYGTPDSRWRAYVNQICLYCFLDWVQTEYDLQTIVWESYPQIPAFWEFVNGTLISLNGRRIVLIPSEAIDDGELEVPQEWVDIPGWAADFYLAVQVKADGEWVRFWGYTTHQELKTLAQYDSVDRTYCMDASILTKDLNAFWMAYKFCQAEDIQAAIPSLPELSIDAAENMLQRLSSSKANFPRLEIPFTSWGALLENEQYRKRLYQQKQQITQKQSSSTVHLSAWLQSIYDIYWQTIDTFLNSNTGNLAFNFRSGTDTDNTSIKRAKLIDLRAKPDSLEVILVVALIPKNNEQFDIRVQLHPFNNEYLPLNINLILLSESAEIIQEVQSRVQDNYVQLKLFEGEIGERFSIKIVIDNYEVIENFMI